jgi:ubiquinone/menaquinone biosynthesis C-methylase UbiE
MSEQQELSLQEIEQLAWYDFSAYIGIPYFHQGGMKATDRLSDLCQVKPESKVLVVGCGTGYNACYLARTRGCFVDGFDLAENMVAKARERAEAEGVTSKVTFRVADAYSMPFEDNQYDVVLTEYVSMFLDRNRAFREIIRVLKPGGCLGINELYKGGHNSRVRQGEDRWS